MYGGDGIDQVFINRPESLLRKGLGKSAHFFLGPESPEMHDPDVDSDLKIRALRKVTTRCCVRV